MITALKTAGVWATFDLFYFLPPTSSGSNSPTFNWVNTTVGLLTAHGTINSSINQYAASDGSTGYYSSSFNVNAGKAINGSAEFGHFCLSEAAEGISVFQTTGSKSFSSLAAASSAINNMAGALNTSTSGTWSSKWGSTVGHWVIQQNSTTVLEAFLDGASLGASTQTNSVDIGTVQIFKSSGGSFTSRKTSFVHYGSKLTSAQQLALSKALYTFLATMSVKPLAGYLGLTTGPTNAAPYKHVSTGPTGNDLVVPETTSSTNLSGLLQCRAGAYPYCLIRVSDPNYLNLWRLEVHNGDHTTFDTTNDRCQLHTQQSLPAGTVGDISFSFWIENGSVPGSGFNDINDLHDNFSGVNCGPTHGILPGNLFYVWIYWNPTGTFTNFPSVACAQGVWHHVRTTWSPAAGTGRLQSWLDGVQIVNFTGNVGSPNAGYYQQMALYRNPTTSPFAIWYANFEFDSSGTQPFASRVASPLPVPPLV
jgi:hypothetical protein